MAASKPSQSKPQIDRRIMKSFQHRFEKLSCPYTQDVEESWLVELVLRPGEPRIRLIEWLFCKLDSRLDKLIEPQYGSDDAMMDSRIQRVLRVAAMLGLCRQDDVHLIRGTSSAARQVAFMDQLLDIVCTVEAADDPQGKTTVSPGAVSSATSLEEQFNHDCQLMDNLASQGNVNCLFRPSVKLLPADLMRVVEQGWQEHGHQSGDKPLVPDLRRLQNMADQADQELQVKEAILQELRKEHIVGKEDAQTKDRLWRKLQLSLSELAQVIDSFIHCYENEIRPWCNKTPPQFGDLGPAFRRVYTLQQQFSALTQSFTSIRASHCNIRDKLGPLIAESSETVCLTALGSFQEVIDILEGCISRHQDSTDINTSRLRTSNQSEGTK